MEFIGEVIKVTKTQAIVDFGNCKFKISLKKSYGYEDLYKIGYQHFGQIFSLIKE